MVLLISMQLIVHYKLSSRNKGTVLEIIEAEEEGVVLDKTLDDRDFLRLLMYIFDAVIIVNLWFLRYQMINYKYTNHEAG